jgi:hypothetical protein
MITHVGTIRHAGMTFLGVLSLFVTAAAMLYTSASDAMVSPKLMDGHWKRREIFGRVMTQYANPEFVSETCATPLRDVDPLRGEAGAACLNVHYSGECELLRSI